SRAARSCRPSCPPLLSLYSADSPVIIPPLFLFTDTAATEISTLSLHDALPICPLRSRYWTHSGCSSSIHISGSTIMKVSQSVHADRKSTRLNSSHVKISYAVFCLKKKRI